MPPLQCGLAAFGWAGRMEIVKAMQLQEFEEVGGRTRAKTGDRPMHFILCIYRQKLSLNYPPTVSSVRPSPQAFRPNGRWSKSSFTDPNNIFCTLTCKNLTLSEAKTEVGVRGKNKTKHNLLYGARECEMWFNYMSQYIYMCACCQRWWEICHPVTFRSSCIQLAPSECFFFFPPRSFD